MFPGSSTEDNWYMSRRPIIVHDVGEFKECVCDLLAATFKLQDAKGNPITVRMGKLGVLIVESAASGTSLNAEQQEYVRCCALSAAQRELSQYIGIPMCQDCKWKLGTDITNNCDCSGEMTPEQKGKHEAALKRARELQAIIAQLTEAKPQQKGKSA